MKEVRSTLRDLVFGRRVRFARFGSEWCTYTIGISDEPHRDHVHHEDYDGYVPGLSRWKKTVRGRDRRSKLDEWVNGNL